MTKKENFIHIKFGHENAIETKKDILSTEMDLVRMKKRLTQFSKARINELKLKQELKKNLRSLKTYLTHLHKKLPEVEIPKLLKEHHQKSNTMEEVEEEAEKETEFDIKEDTKMNKLDRELEDIQQRLKELE